MNNFITRFQSFITENELFAKDERVLLAISGGVDSVVMCHLFQQAGFQFGIAHCNFQLRGEASDGDETFVNNLARKLKVPFFSKSFDTEAFAARHKISIQMAARELRYEWLEQIRQTHDFQWLATAHHLNDSTETFFYNFAKGTGIRGLHGIPLKNERIVRPLLFATKDEILDFAKTENIAYREDASNEEIKYDRNKIRHQVIPVFKALNPDFEQTAADNLRRIREVEFLFDWAVAQIRREVVKEREEKIQINVSKLLDYQFATSTLLYEWLKPFGFHPDLIGKMLEAQTGAVFYSLTHRLLVDRKSFIIEKQALEPQNEQFVITEEIRDLQLNVGNFTFEYKTGRPETFNDDDFTVYLDAEKLRFPLTLRHWQPGDFFYPLGLRGNRQKIQDFFTNQKLARFDKERVWILTSGEDICWVVGYRPDERFKITATTKAYWVIRFKKS